LCCLCVYASNRSEWHSFIADLYVRGTGVGVRPDKLDSMFDAFSQVQSGQVTGTGLGLFGLRRRVEGLNGTCGARANTQSSTGTGTVVWFALPYLVDHMETMMRSSSDDMSVRMKPVPSTPKMSSQVIANLIREYKLTAIIVDDTKTIRKLMEKFLLQLGFHSVLSYENGSKGLEGLVEHQVDFVFTDIQMPIMTGPEVRSCLLYKRRQHCMAAPLTDATELTNSR
jgi:CheY-like chemotaxis protein